MDNLVGWLQSSSYQGRLIYRTTNAGHWNCSMYHERPVLNESYVWPYFGRALWPYTWQLVDTYNAYAVERLRALGVEILYSNILSRNRPDGHGNPDDCLHYKLPGVPDWWATALYNHIEADYLATLLPGAQKSLRTAVS